MFTAVLGTPSPIANWTLHAIQTAAQILDGGQALIRADTLEAFRSERRSLSARADMTILYSNAPEAALVDLLARAGCGIIVATDSARDTVSFSAASRGLPADLALREYFKSVATLSAAFDGNPIMHVTSAAYSQTVAGFLADLSAACGLNPSDEVFRTITAALAAGHPDGSRAPVGELVIRDIPGAARPGGYSVLDEEHGALVDRAGEQFDLVRGRDRVSRFTCPQFLYVADGVAYRPDGKWLPLLGPRRCLLWGPYVHLPRGQWSVTGRISVRGNISGNKLRVEVLRAVVLHKAFDTALPDEGTFEFDLDFEIVEPRDPLEVTFTILEGAIEGALRLDSIIFRRRI